MSSKITIKKKRIYKEEDGGVPANHTGAAVANWNPLLGGPKVRKRHVELDGRTKQFRNVVKRIKTRNAKSQERAIKKKFAMWGVTTNPFVKENTIMDESKYLKTKTGSIEDAVITSLNTSPNENPNNTRPILHLPKKKYLESKDNSLEQMAINALVEKTDKVDPKELKGKLKDREDADIDNDGDVDQSDRFLHKRRKAINKKSKSKYVTGQGTKGDQNIRDRDDEEEATRSKKRPTAEALDKGVGSAAYTNYTKNITPGEEVDPKIVSREARIQSLAQKMTKKLQQRQKRVIDDAYRFGSVEDAIDALPAEIVKEEELSTDERKALPDSAFVFPKERKYPINDIDHARAALSMGAQHATASEYAKIKAAVKKKYPEIDVGGEKKEEVEIEAGRIDIKEYLRKRDDDEWDPKLRKGSFRRHRNIKREKHPIKTGSVEIHPEEVEEALGLGGWKGSGIEKMPKTDPKKKTSRGTDAYVTGKTKIQRLPKKEEVEVDEQEMMQLKHKKSGQVMRMAKKVYQKQAHIQRERGWVPDSKQPHMRGGSALQHSYEAEGDTELQEMDFKVKIKGLPVFYVPGRSVGEIRAHMRKNLKRPQDVEWVERSTVAQKKKDFRLRAQDKDSG